MIIPALTVPELAALADPLPRDIWPYMSLMITGFVIGLAGHLVRVRALVALGIVMIFTATVVMPIALNVSRDTPREVRDLATRSR